MWVDGFTQWVLISYIASTLVPVVLFRLEGWSELLTYPAFIFLELAL